jgi:hypothetical protein
VKKCLLFRIFLISLVVGGQCVASDMVFLKVFPGQGIEDFNKLKLIKGHIRHQKREQKRTSFGVSDLPTSSQKKISSLRKSKVWTTSLTTYQNNKIVDFTVFNDKATAEMAAKVFEDVTLTLGDQYFPYRFKSLGKTGVAFEWERQGKLYNLKLSKPRATWSYHMSVKRAPKHRNPKPMLDLSHPEVAALLAPIMESEDDILNFASN